MSSIGVRSLTVAVKGKELVSNIDLAVEHGEWVCVIGPNGAGKTTLLRALASLAEHTGSIEIGSDVRSLSARHRAALLAYCPQDPLLPSHMTALQYVLLARSARQGLFGLTSSLDRTVAIQCLQDVDLGGFERRTLAGMSGGERRRTAIAQTLAQETSVILLDEPTASLDIGHQQQLLEMLDGLRRRSGLTMVSTAHDLTLAGQYADRLVLMNDGRIVAQGSPADVLTPSLISEHYGAAVRIEPGDNGQVVVTPVRPIG